jgi:phosphatidylserine/phosphatidylglycerophosphate/cardiolipin synthase-like enzyme
MRILDEATKQPVQKAIDVHSKELESIEGFVSAEPGFPIVDGQVLKEPAIIVFVKHKKPPTSVARENRAPRQLGEYRVSVMQADPMRQVMMLEEHADMAAALAAAAVPAKLTYKPIKNNPINADFTVAKPLLCHVGPDAGWPVLKPFLEGTKKTLSVAMYDFNADYIAKTFMDAVLHTKLQVTLTWDNGMTAPETQIEKQLQTKLKNQLDLSIIQCGANQRFATAYHEKVAVRDASSFWLSSGNWSLRSQPNIDPIGDPADAAGMYAKGNREWHVVVDDAKLAAVFEQYIKYDSDETKQQNAHAAQLARAAQAKFPDLFVPIDELQATSALAAAAPPKPVKPASLPKSGKAVKISPVLTPDNYLGRIMDLITKTQKSIYLQYAYINYSSAKGDEGFTKMLAALGDLTHKPHIDVRIIIGSGSAADQIRKLVQAGFRDTSIRSQANIHNKGIVVDGEIVLVSSANWSGDGVLRNRDAGLIIHDPDIAQYYQSVFIDDWDHRAHARIGEDAPVIAAAAGAPTPPGMVRMSWRDYYD